VLCAIRAACGCAHFKPLELSNTAWAFAILQNADEPLLAWMARSVQSMGREFPPEGLATIAWAFVEVRFMDQRVFESLAAAAEVKMADFEPEEFRMLLWALPVVSLPLAVGMLRLAKARGRRPSAQCLSALVAESEQRGQLRLQARLLRSLPMAARDPSFAALARLAFRMQGRAVVS